MRCSHSQSPRCPCHFAFQFGSSTTAGRAIAPLPFPFPFRCPFVFDFELPFDEPFVAAPPFRCALVAAELPPIEASPLVPFFPAGKNWACTLLFSGQADRIELVNVSTP